MAVGYNEHGSKMSRSDASQIRELFSKVSGLDDTYLAEKLADYYIAHETELTDASVAEFLRDVKLGKVAL